MREILGYSLDENQCVSDLGRFEGEPAYVPYCWQFYLDGFEDDTVYCGSDHYSVYFVDNEMRAKFPDLLTFDPYGNHFDFAIVLWQTDQGFVNSECFTKDQYDSFVADCESENEEESE